MPSHVHERLRQYAEFIDSPKDYVIGQALERLFRSDKGFVQWQASRVRTTPAVEAPPSASRTGLKTANALYSALDVVSVDTETHVAGSDPEPIPRTASTLL